MKLVLHIGMPKAGSSALQQSLLAMQGRLGEAGLVYPAGRGLPKNHNFLVCAGGGPTRLPRIFRQVYDGKPEALERDFAAFRSGVKKRVRKSGAQTAILSGEMLFRPCGPKRQAVLARILRDLADEIELLTYVRAPAAYYLSHVAQALKASARIAPPGAVGYRRAIQGHGKIADRATIVTYDRGSLQGGDITLDVLGRYAPGLVADAGRLPKVQEANQSLSAEALDILQTYRAHNHAERNGVFTADSQTVLRILTAEDTRLPGEARPRLREAARERIEAASTDLLWLRDTHGVRFPDLAYDRVGSAVQDADPPASMAEIVHIDAERRGALLAAVMRRLGGGRDRSAADARAGDATAMARLRALAGEGGAPRFKTTMPGARAEGG